MTRLILTLALLTSQPEGVREKPCVRCLSQGVVWRWMLNDNCEFLKVVENCPRCDGYGKERTIYGELLRESKTPAR